MGFKQAFLSYKAANAPRVRAERMEEALRQHADNKQAHELLYYAVEHDQCRAIRRQPTLMIGEAHFPDPVDGGLLLDILEQDNEQAHAAAAALLVHEPEINIDPDNVGPLQNVILRYGYEQYLDPYATTDLTRHELYRAAEGAYYNPEVLETLLSDATDFGPGELQAAFCRYANWAHRDTMDVRTPAMDDGADTVVRTFREHGMPVRGGVDFGRELRFIEGRSLTHLLPVLMALHDGTDMGFRDMILDLSDDVRILDQDDCNALYDYATRPGSVPLSERLLQRLIDENRLPDRSLMKRIKNRSTGPAQYLRDHLPRRADYASELNESTPSQDQ